MVFVQFASPLRELRFEFLQHLEPRHQFNMVSLTVVKSQCLYPLIALQRPSKAGGGVLTTREEDESSFMHEVTVMQQLFLSVKILLLQNK